MSYRSLRGERGFALVSVLWAVSILSLIAVSMISSGTLSYQMQRNTLRRVQAESIVDAAMTLAFVGLLDPRPEQRWRVDGIARDVVFDGSQVSVSVQDQLGLIDLNEADTSLLKSLFESAGVSADLAAALADHIVDWRTPGDLQVFHRANGAAYRGTGYNYLPRDDRFESVDELNLVMGITAAIFARVAPALTVHSHRPTLDPAFAPREALLALPGADPRSVDEIVRRRLSAASVATPQGVVNSGVIDPAVPLTGRTFGITGELSVGENRVVRRAIILITGNPARPHLVLDWK